MLTYTPPPQQQQQIKARLITTFFPNKPNLQWMRRVGSDGSTLAKIETDNDGQLIADNVR
jgi:hypothetical protein